MQNSVLMTIGDPFQQLFEVTHGERFWKSNLAVLLGMIVHQFLEIFVEVFKN